LSVFPVCDTGQEVRVHEMLLSIFSRRSADETKHIAVSQVERDNYMDRKGH